MVKNGILIINYHYVFPNGTGTFAGLKGVPLDLFERHLISLNKNFASFRPTSMPFDDGNDKQLRFLITFDDGSQQIFDHVLPLLKKHHTTAIIFCCSLPYLEKRVLNVQKTHLLNGKWGWQGLKKKFEAALATIKEPWEKEDAASLGLSRMYRYDSADIGKFKRQLNVEIPYPIVEKVLDMLFEAEFGEQAPIAEKLYLSADALQRCADYGISVGVHTHSHYMLSRLSAEKQSREISMCKFFFQDRLGIETNYISYPYGISGSWNEHTKRLSKNHGLAAGLTLGRAIYDPDTCNDPFEIPRYDANDVFSHDGNLMHESNR
jgi:peptidoglycan/xylan/chitin deacetylase (PgdA/CDA1 family)